tara:strand:- start:335 stop:1630 length:1296 start_codon:yes stop_codon:yes gene_type:complete
MEESNKFNLRILNDFSSIDLREANEIEILNYLKDSFQELEEKKISFSIEAINNEFLDIQNQLIEIKNSEEYKTKEERNYLNRLIENCKLRPFLSDLLVLDSNSNGDDDFDLRDITLKSEMKNLVEFYQRITIKNNVIENDLIEKYKDYRLKLLNLINRVAFSFFKTFGLNTDIDNFFQMYIHLFTGNKKFKLPDGITPESEKIFSFNFKDGIKFFSFNRLESEEWLRKRKIIYRESFYEWFEKKLKQYGVPVPPPEDKYPKLHNAWVNQTTKDLPKMYGDFNKLFNMDYSQLLDPIYYFYKPEFQDLWEKSKKEFFNQYSLRDNFIQSNYNNSDIDNSNLNEIGENKPSGFVYLIRNQDIFKIGITENLLNRMSQLEPDEIIDVIKCSNFRELERDLHRDYKNCRIPQTEYFRLNEMQILEVSKKFKLWAK